MAVLDASDISAAAPVGKRARAADSPDGGPAVAAEFSRVSGAWRGMGGIIRKSR